MVDVFSADQAMRWFARIAAGGALGAIAGPLATRVLVKALGLCGLMMLAAGGFGLVMAKLHVEGLCVSGITQVETRRADRLGYDDDLPGDPNCQESDVEPKRSLFNGLAQLLARSTRKAGLMTIEAYTEEHAGPKLPTVRLTVRTRMP